MRATHAPPFSARRARVILAIVASLVALAWSGWLARLHVTGRATPLDRIEASLADLRLLLAGPRPPPAEVVVVAIDDETMRREGVHSLPRTTIARLVWALVAAHPRVVAVDVLFLEPDSNPAADQALARALRAAPAVLAAAAVFEAEDAEAGVPTAQTVYAPTPSVGGGIGAGLVNVAADASGTPRHLPLVVRTAAGDVFISLALRAAALAARTDPVVGDGEVRIGPTRIPLDLGLHLPLRPYGRRQTITTVSAASVLDGRTPVGVLADRIVVIGATALGGADTFPTAFDPIMPGVEVLATGIAHLVAGRGLTRDASVRRLDAAAAVVLCLGSILLMALAPPGPALASILILALAWLAATAVAFASGSWWSATLPLAALAPPAFLCLMARQVIERRWTLNLAVSEGTLRRLQPAALAERLAREPAYLRMPVEQVLPVLFIDLSAFTRQSERLGPVRTRDVLKGFHDLVDAVATTNGGLVLNFMGDGAMIVFGVTDAEPDRADRAVRTADELVARTRAWIASDGDLAAGGLDVRVGGHYGPVIVSRLGSETNQQITVAGDTVNVASRLLAVASAAAARLAVSADLLAAATTFGETLQFDERRTVAIRGRSQPLDVWLRRADGSSGAGSPS